YVVRSTSPYHLLTCTPRIYRTISPPPTPPLFPYTTLFRSPHRSSRAPPLSCAASLPPAGERQQILGAHPGERGHERVLRRFRDPLVCGDADRVRSRGGGRGDPGNRVLQRHRALDVHSEAFGVEEVGFGVRFAAVHLIARDDRVKGAGGEHLDDDVGELLVGH